MSMLVRERYILAIFMTLQSYMNTDNINAIQRGTNKVHVNVVGERNKHSSLSTIFGIVKCYLYTVKYRQNKLKTSFKKSHFHLYCNFVHHFVFCCAFYSEKISIWY